MGQRYAPAPREYTTRRQNHICNGHQWRNWGCKIREHVKLNKIDQYNRSYAWDELTTYIYKGQNYY
eukprot:9438191-Ditylum_brightwellii.AAC.1